MVYRNESIVLCPILPWGQFWLVMAQVNKLETNVFMVPSYLTVQCEIIRPGKKGRNTKICWVKFLSCTVDFWVNF